MKSKEEIEGNIAIKQGVIDSIEELGCINLVGEGIINMAKEQIKMLKWVLEVKDNE